MAVAYPFVEVKPDTKGLVPTALREPGVLAIVGVSTGGAAGIVELVTDIDAATAAFVGGPLVNALAVALKQSPAPAVVYGLKVATDDLAGWREAFDVLSAKHDVTFVTAAERPIQTLAAGAVDVVDLLKSHCENNAANGQPRIAVAAVDPTLSTRDTKYVTDVTALIGPYKSHSGRMVVVVARGVTGDAAAAAAAAIAARAPETSMVLKRVGELKIPSHLQFTPGEIIGLSKALTIPIIDPALIPGESLHLAEGVCLSTDAALQYIDVVRLLDDIDFALKANLVGLIGDARVTRSGVNAVRRRLEGVLDGYVNRQAITSYRILMDILPILDKPEASWTPAEVNAVKDARTERRVEAVVVIVIGPAVHRLVINLQPTFAAA